MRWWIAGAAFALAAVTVPAHAATSDTQVWTVAGASGRVTKNVLASAEITGRYTDDVSRLGQFETRVQVGTPAGKSVTLWLGYVHISAFSPTGAVTGEEQVVEQISWTIGKIGRATLSSRTRLEQRFVGGADRVAWRTREQVRLVVPLGAHAPSVVVSVEPFVSLNRTSTVRPGIDQVRSFAGLAVPVAEQTDVEVGYLNQYLNRASGDRSNNTLSVAINYRF